ncbi:DUF4268 domain-containing protein [Reyranella sp. MMS21-HV4-11]|uniref:DUF4268 domain-containing protein n=1 Tax=Reyranella humidisoli TaxID=2849149 RepID=A0ABS6IGA1_9HYPH|nr:DUF4268 domain-containing protein [Reyranella sp. MMS21-HV4-11]MBU8873351.1 DUF4268 domain-containing protein [Reyranella sp. MMS21-HV4-11]
MKTPLGKLERINLREAWKHEAAEFTPWLAQEENLELLAEALGLVELELVGTEHWVGDFKLDVLCSDDDGQVIIENQLEKTNHSHLGQIITYAAGVGAKKVIWLAESFRPEHVAALDFLNQSTTAGLNFFAAEVELWRIGDSPMAPSFNVLVKPNDWTKTSRESAKVATTTTPTKQRQLKFWTEWSAWLKAKASTLRPQKPLPQHWTNLALGRAGIHLAASVVSRDRRVSVEVYIDHPNSKSMFKQLQAQQQALENQLGMQLQWNELPDGHACRIVHLRPDSPLEDEVSWPIYFAWLEDAALRLSTVFRPIVRTLS